MSPIVIALFACATFTLGTFLRLAYLASTDFLTSKKRQQQINSTLEWSVVGAICMVICATLYAVSQVP